MTPEEISNFAEIAYQHGKAVAESRDDSFDKTGRTKDYRSWRIFRKARATNDEMKLIIDTSYKEGYVQMMRYCGADERDIEKTLEEGIH